MPQPGRSLTHWSIRVEAKLRSVGEEEAQVEEFL